jgi:acetyl esterase/lipase
MNTKMILSLSLCLVCGMACASISPIPAPVSTDTLIPKTTATDLPAEDFLPLKVQSLIPDETNRIEHELTYCTLDGVALKADVYFPTEEAGILLIYIHGGGWRSGSRNGGSGFLDFPALLRAGYTLASIDYRLAPEYKMPAMIEDVKCAVRYFRAHAIDYHIDPDRIGVWGTSAGGHLVSMLGTADETSGFDIGEYLDVSGRVQAVADLFGPANMQSYPVNPRTTLVAQTIFGVSDLSDPALAATSPVTYISPDDPPFLILQGEVDQTVPVSQSQELYDKLTAVGVDAQLVIVRGGGHGLNDPDQTPTRAELTQMIVEFFDAKLK